jgi:uncharacterized sulfatase
MGMKNYLTKTPSVAVAKYRAMCEWYDITCGDLMDFLSEHGLDKNTLVAHVTDNGWIQDPERPNRHAPRSKRSSFEMGIRTPIMFRWPGVIKPELDTLSLASSIDIAPTLLEMTGVPPTGKMHGINLLEKKVRRTRETIFAEVYAHDFSTVDASRTYRILIGSPWKLILPNFANKPGQSPELYNLFTDPFEQNNKAFGNPGMVKRLETKLEQWWTRDT